jgi:hypothetical protein
LKEQEKLMANRDEIAIKGKPILIAKVHLPSGELVDQFDESWQLDNTFRTFDGSSSGNRTMWAGALWPAALRWHRWALEDGTFTFVFSVPEKAWKSKPVTVKVHEGVVTPNSITFELDSSKKHERE